MQRTRHTHQRWLSKLQCKVRKKRNRKRSRLISRIRSCCSFRTSWKVRLGRNWLLLSISRSCNTLCLKISRTWFWDRRKFHLMRRRLLRTRSVFGLRLFCIRQIWLKTFMNFQVSSRQKKRNHFWFQALPWKQTRKSEKNSTMLWQFSQKFNTSLFSLSISFQRSFSRICLKMKIKITSAVILNSLHYAHS